MGITVESKPLRSPLGDFHRCLRKMLQVHFKCRPFSEGKLPRGVVSSFAFSVSHMRCKYVSDQGGVLHINIYLIYLTSELES